MSSSLNFTRAAQACHVTQPALTKSIRRLEEELGGPLLLRERSNTQLTALGETMLPLLQRTFEAAETARVGARAFRTQDVARLSLGLGDGVQPDTVMPVVRELGRRFSNLELKVRHGGVAALNEWLLGSEIDVSVTGDAQGLTERANRWTLFTDAIVAHVPEGHVLVGEEALTFESLQGHAVVGRLAASEDDGAGLDGRLPAGCVRHQGGTDEQREAMVQLGMGVALSTARRRVPVGVVCRGIEPASCIEVVVAAIAGRPMSRTVDGFLRLARARSWEGPVA